jgi:hypothetical protein
MKSVSQNGNLHLFPVSSRYVQQYTSVEFKDPLELEN